MRKQKNKLAELRKYMQIGDVMAKNSKICPECGRKMKQQFIGLQHCKCGISWMKNIGYFERTSMIFDDYHSE